jgi:hypothetical protein
VKELPPDPWSALLAMMTWSISTSASTLRSQWTLKLTSFMLLTHVWTPFSSSQMFRTRKAVCLHYWKCRLPILSGLQQLDLKLGASPIDLLTETANQGTCRYM